MRTSNYFMSRPEGKQRAAEFLLFHHLEKYGLSYACNGVFTDADTRRVLMLAEQNMNDEREARTRKRVYFVIVESLQNITRHQCEDTNSISQGFFSLHKSADAYIVTSGNVIENKFIPDLRKKLERVNTLDASGLNDLYNDVLRAGEISSRGGAGLGLIDMVRKSGNRLNYEFVPLDNNWSYFYFQSIVTDGSNESYPENLSDVVHLHEIIKRENISSIYHGKFCEENLSSLLSATVEGLSNAGGEGHLKQSAGILVTLLTNLCKLGCSIDLKEDPNGMLAISRKNNKLIFTILFQPREEQVKAILDVFKGAGNSDRSAGMWIEELRKKSGNDISVEVEEDINGRKAVLLNVHISL